MVHSQNPESQNFRSRNYCGWNFQSQILEFEFLESELSGLELSWSEYSKSECPELKSLKSEFPYSNSESEFSEEEEMSLGDCGGSEVSEPMAECGDEFPERDFSRRRSQWRESMA